MGASSPSAFPLFPQLPKELRIKIFEEAIPLFPRIVEICQLRPEWATSAGAHHSSGEEETESGDGGDSGFEEITEEAHDTSANDNEAMSPKVTTDLDERGPEASSTGTVGAQEVEHTEDTSTSSSDASSDHDNNSDTRSTSSEDYLKPEPNPHPFYSMTALPPLLQVNSESREVALRHYPLSLANPQFDRPAATRINVAIDMLFFPAWCFEHCIDYFESTCTPEFKDSIRRLAFETLVWYSYSDSGYLNGQVEVDKMRHLEEVLMVERLPGPSGCGCCHEFDRPEHGLITFVYDVDGKQRPVLRADQIMVPGEVVTGKEFLEGWSNFDEKRLGDLQKQFHSIEARDPTWERPRTVRFASLLRDGKRI